MNFRLKNVIVSVVFPLLYILFMNIGRFEGFILYGTVFVGLVIFYFLLFWALNFDVYPQGFFTILSVPALFFGSYMLIYRNFLSAGNIDNLYRIGISILFIVLLYYFVSAQNILNVSHFTAVSLSQAALTANNFYTILTFFMSILSVFLLPGIDIYIKILLTSLIFITIYSVFVLLHHIDFTHLFFGSFLFATSTLTIMWIYLLGYFDPSSVLLLVIYFSVVFRGITVISLYSSKKILSVFDFIQIIVEALIIATILTITGK